MSDELIFLDEVKAHPDDLLRRLVFADWLEEQGSELCVAKARFLRVWCYLHEIPLTDLEGYATAAEELERYKQELPEEWLLGLDAKRFRLKTRQALETRLIAFFRAHGIEDPEIDGVTSEKDTFLVYYSELVDSVVRIPRQFRVCQKTGRVHTSDYSFTKSSSPGNPSPSTVQDVLGERAQVDIWREHSRLQDRRRKSFWGEMSIFLGLIVVGYLTMLFYGSKHAGLLMFPTAILCLMMLYLYITEWSGSRQI